jgi:hypothetical protein
MQCSAAYGGQKNNAGYRINKLQTKQQNKQKQSQTCKIEKRNK